MRYKSFFIISIVLLWSFFVVIADAAFSTIDCTNASHRLVMGGGVVEMPQVECEALGEVWTDMAGSGWTINTGWDTVSDASTWHGVNTTAGQVSALVLDSNNLNGSIPQELGNLSALVNLQLQANSLSGFIPSEIGNLTNVTIMRLFNNQLSGAIPPELGNMTSISWMHLFNNQLSGAIPPELGNLPQVTQLYLQDNNLSGSIPVELGDLTTLVRLEIFNNQLSGSIPASFGNLINLQWLHLYNNQLSGTIPLELGNMTNLQRLNIYDNELSGSVPLELTNLSNLQALNFYNNQLSGDIPDFSGIASISGFRIYGNNFIFADFEDDFNDYSDGTPTTFEYSPQSMTEPAQLFTLTEGDDLTITPAVAVNPSGNDQYQWYKDNNPIVGATDRIFSITSISPAEAGVYTYQITNSVVTGLVLGGDDIIVVVNALPETDLQDDELENDEVEEESNAYRKCKSRYGDDSYKQDYEKVKYFKNKKYDLYIAMQSVYRTYRLSGDNTKDLLEQTQPDVYQQYKEYRRYKKYKDCKKMQ